VHVMETLSPNHTGFVPPLRDYSLSGTRTKWAIETGLSQAQWYRTSIPRPQMKALMQRNDARALRDTVLYYGLMIVFAVVGVLTWLSWVSLLAFFCYGVLYGSGADSRWHEAGHGTAFKTRWMNSVVYQMACFMMMRNPTTWRWSHARHHTDTIIVGRDPEIILQRPPALWMVVANLVGLVDVPKSIVAMGRHSLGRLDATEQQYVPDTEHHKVAWVARVWLLIYAGVITLSILTTSFLPLMVIGLPRMYGAWHHVMTGVIQHLGLAEDVTDHRLNTRTCYMNPISRFIYWNMNYHVEHHMFPMVPFHRLPELHEVMKSDTPPAIPSIAKALKQIVPVLWAQRSNPESVIIPQLPGNR
jgi:fatty acid desaturase